MKFYNILLVVAFCALGVSAQDSYESAGVRFMLKIYDECLNSDGFSPCLKKKAITFLDRVARMDKLPLIEGVTLIKSKTSPIVEPQIQENEIEQNLPRSVEGQDVILNNMLSERINNLLGSRTIEISMPKVSEMIEEGRKGSGGQGGGGGGKNKMGGMMGGMMMAVAAKMAALIPIAIAGLFLLAGKALITAKIALLISGIIALKKLFASKHQGGGGHGHGGWSSGGGGGGGWQSSGGGWDKRSFDEAQQLAYRSYQKP